MNPTGALVGRLPHNHPIPPSAKVPFEVRKQYSACIVANVVIGTKPLRIERRKSCNFGNSIFIANSITAQQTKTILGGKLPEEQHPALNNNRKQAMILVKCEKVKSCPESFGYVVRPSVCSVRHFKNLSISCC